MNTQILTLQLALFFRDIVDRPDVEFKDLNEDLLNIFDAVPSIIPVPRGLPSDVPMITQRSENNQYICNIARSRIDLIFQRVDGEKTNIELLKDFNAKVNGFAKYVLGKQEVNRFGLIARYFHKDEKSIETIRNKYFSNLPKNINELTVRYNESGTYNDLVINDIVEIKDAMAKLDGVDYKGILIQRDINNQPDHDRLLDYKKLIDVSEKYSSKISEVSIEGLIK